MIMCVGLELFHNIRDAKNLRQNNVKHLTQYLFVTRKIGLKQHC